MTKIRLRQNGRHRVCYGRRGLVRYQYAEQVDIEVVVDQVHAAVGTGTGWTVNGALRESAVGSVKGGLEHVGELVEDIGDLGGVGMVVHKGDKPCSCVDQGLKAWPLVDSQRPARGMMYDTSGCHLSSAGSELARSAAPCPGSRLP